jgi:hypothetical protein
MTGQLNSCTHVRALLVLQDRSILAHATTQVAQILVQRLGTILLTCSGALWLCTCAGSGRSKRAMLAVPVPVLEQAVH